MKQPPKRPDFIKHYSEIVETEPSHYPGSDEIMAPGSPFGKFFGLKKLGIHHGIMPPGTRTSWPHAERDEEEFVYVISGHPEVWIDGELIKLNPGDGVGFPCETGVSHTFINNTKENVEIMVVGEKSKKENKVYYPLHPKRNKEIGEALWADAPQKKLGPHDGMPDLVREKIKRGEIKG